MPDITTFEIVENEIKKAGGKPVVLEALWDTLDLDGWNLSLYLYTRSGPFFNRKETRHELGHVTIPGMQDARDEVKKRAGEFGKKAIQKYGLVFYFPSEKYEPDHDCPKWTERHLGINCADCGILIIPTTSPYLPKDICYNCYLKRDSPKRTYDEIKNDKPYTDDFILYSYKNGEYKIVDYSALVRDFAIAPYITDIIERNKTDDVISMVSLERSDMLELRDKLEKEIDQKLLAHKAAETNKTENPGRLRIDKLEYKGIEYEFTARHFEKSNQKHREMSALISGLKKTEDALAHEQVYRIFFHRGITYRDFSIIEFAERKKTATVAGITEEYQKILTETEIADTLKKLEKAGCLIIKGNEVFITEMAKYGLGLE